VALTSLSSINIYIMYGVKFMNKAPTMYNYKSGDAQKDTEHITASSKEDINENRKQSLSKNYLLHTH